MNNSGSLIKIAPALLKAQKVMGDAIKDARNPFFKSSYADLNAVREAVIPALNEHGITVLQPMVSENGKQFVRTTLLHESGEMVWSDTEIVVGKQNDPQAAGSAISYARRYGLQALLCVGAVDDDAESSMVRETKVQPKVVQLKPLVSEPTPPTTIPEKPITPKPTPTETPKTSGPWGKPKTKSEPTNGDLF